jgi:UDP:flavonoid glycosyltransferase YjiC (YdhE family)
VDLAQVARQADWVLSHGNHGTAASFAAAGVPQLLIPLHHEHLFLALRLVAQGAAVMAMQDQSGYRAAIDALLTNPLIARQAQVLQMELPPYCDLTARAAVVQALRAA